MTASPDPVLISDPAAIKTLYTEPAHAMPHGHVAALAPVLGPRALTLLDGDEHLARRRLLLPLFHGDRLRGYQSLVEQLVADEVGSWPIGERIVIQQRMEAVTLEVILRVIFGVAEGERLERLRVLLGDVLAETALPAAQSIGRSAHPGGGALRPELERLLAEVDELLHAEIAEHRAAGGLAERRDVLSALMLASLEDGGRLDDGELRDQLMTLLLAGHETTATALAWAFDLLLRHPRELGLLRASLARGEDAYLRATIAESLRIRPVVPITGRCLAKPATIEGRELAPGTEVMSAIWLTHTRAEVYPEPFAFRPERFLEEDPDTFAWIPYGGGVHRCIGGAFAELEIRAVLSEVLTRCELHKADPAPERAVRRLVTMAPRNGTPVVVTERRPAA